MAPVFVSVIRTENAHKATSISKVNFYLRKCQRNMHCSKSCWVNWQWLAYCLSISCQTHQGLPSSISLLLTCFAINFQSLSATSVSAWACRYKEDSLYMHLWVCSVFFPYPVTFLLQLQARIHSPPHLKTHSVSHTSRWTTSLYCPWGCRCLLLFCLLLSLLPSVNLSIPLFLPLSLPASLFITLSAVSPHSHSPVSFGLISSSITASHFPSFRLLPSCISNLSIVSPPPPLL